MGSCAIGQRLQQPAKSLRQLFILNTASNTQCRRLKRASVRRCAYGNHRKGRQEETLASPRRNKTPSPHAPYGATQRCHRRTNAHAARRVGSARKRSCSASRSHKCVARHSGVAMQMLQAHCNRYRPSVRAPRPRCHRHRVPRAAVARQHAVSVLSTESHNACRRPTPRMP